MSLFCLFNMIFLFIVKNSCIVMVFDLYAGIFVSNWVWLFAEYYAQQVSRLFFMSVVIHDAGHESGCLSLWFVFVENSSIVFMLFLK